MSKVERRQSKQDEETYRKGMLVMVGTPLGNREDLSPRARRAITQANLLLCEDTRSPIRLLGEDIKLPQRLSCFAGNEGERVGIMLQHLTAGQTVAFISEAGMPIVSDPGRILVRAAVDEGFEVDVVPGPSASVSALCISGFAAKGFRFLGFLPRSGTERKELLAGLQYAQEPTIFYEAGNRVAKLLSDMLEWVSGAGSRNIVIARELTKLHQEIIRGTIADVYHRVYSEGGLRGEVTMILEGRYEIEKFEQTRAASQAIELMLDPKLKPRERARKLASLSGINARELYQRLQNMKLQ